MTALEKLPATLDSVACHAYLSWLLGPAGASEPEGATGLAWILAHSDDGVTWGRLDVAAKVWRLGNAAAPGISPPIRPETLRELRLFGRNGEVLIWRMGQGLRGRILKDADASSPGNAPDSLGPHDESRLILGEHAVASCAHDFTRVGDRTGAEQVLPLVVTTEQLRAGKVTLLVRHYFELDTETNAVRIGATRLVNLSIRSGHGT